MKWRDLTPEQLEKLSRWIDDDAGDKVIDAEQLAEENGFDVVGAYRALARHLRATAERRAAALVEADDDRTETEKADDRLLQALGR